MDQVPDSVVHGPFLPRERQCLSISVDRQAVAKERPFQRSIRPSMCLLAGHERFQCLADARTCKSRKERERETEDAVLNPTIKTRRTKTLSCRRRKYGASWDAISAGFVGLDTNRNLAVLSKRPVALVFIPGWLYGLVIVWFVGRALV
ncbi:hypothetical protein ml_165 [Mollivirus sibericum]|uniref:hypothetical protein n=1 Tax=Mollivirus sibericum TaxID=1678078 RepID=UPI0006B2EDA4|nr:hypothetical protein ml_165 [Mollivirus sibericum]ALD61967.1 hypothetical protein ml_165 [Mollivirus sibericum]